MGRIATTIILLGVFAPMLVSADVLRVPGDYLTIEDAIAVSINGDTILVADGTHKGVGFRNLDFAGKAITVKSENGPENCIVDAFGSPEVCYRTFHFHSGEGPDSVVEGLTITGGCEYPGAGIYCENNSNPTIRGNIITGNHAHCPS
jgi:hypothetical protein